MPDQYDWGLWFGDQDDQLPHSYVYRRDVYLQAGSIYHFQTRNLRPLRSGNPDPVMYLVQGNDIVAFNDDYVGLASEIIFTPKVNDTYKIVIRAFTTSTPGVCDLYQGVNGAPPLLLEANLTFAGTYVWVRWKQGEWFETGRGLDIDLGGEVNVGNVGSLPSDGSDPFMFLIYPEHAVGSKLYWNDDGAGSLQSKIEPPTGGTGTVILGSYARYTGGECRLALVGQSYKAPWMSPGPWAYDLEPVAPTPTVKKYMEHLQQRKPALDELSPDKRDQSVLELQRQMLPEEEVRGQLAPIPAASTELVRRQEIFLDRYRQLEKDLEQMPYEERTAKLAHLKRETMGKEYSEPEPLPQRPAKRAGRPSEAE
jgi:hypothetical protein